MTYAITKDDLTALRTADRVHARRCGDGDSQLEAVKELKTNEVFDVVDDRNVRRIIKTRDRFKAYDGTEKDAKAFAYDISCPCALCWKTVVSLLKVGDEIELRWIAGNNSQNLEGAHFYRDHCNIAIIRKGVEKYAFQMETYVGPNNTARMIRG